MYPMKKIKVAQIMGKWVGGGVEAVIMNYYQNIDKSKIQFDFIFDSDSIDIPENEINSIGGRVLLVPPYQKIFKYKKALKEIFTSNQYDIVHSNINTLSIFPLYVAKKCNISIRIAHSHSMSNKKEFKKNLLKQILRPFSKVYANKYFACSEEAGRWLFGNNTFESGKVTLINNAIDIEKYIYDEVIRDKIRKELGVKEDTLVLGNVGRFVEQKNQLFLLNVFENVLAINQNSKLFLIGQGNLEDEIRKSIKLKKIEDKVLLLGQRKDVNELYQAMDVFALPSLYEGLGMVLIEAQASGLPCLASTNVPGIAKVIPEFKFLNIESQEDIEKWSREVITFFNSRKRKSYYDLIRERGYDIKTEALKLQNKYIELLLEENKKV